MTDTSQKSKGGSGRRWSRRDVLAATGAAGAMFPFLRARPAEGAPLPPRLVLIMQSNGTHQPAFWPTPSDPMVTPAPRMMSPILAPILGDDKLAPKTTLVKGLNNHTGGSGNGHDYGFAGLWSGYRTTGTFNDPWGSGISIDQTLRRALTFTEPFPTLNCGVLASDTPPFKAHRRSFSYLGRRQQVPTEIDVYKLYARFFPAGLTGPDAEVVAKRRLRQKKTVLDYVNGDLRSLRVRLPKLDRDRLEAHEQALRELEGRLSHTITSEVGRPAQCTSARAMTEGLDVWAEDNVPMLTKLMLEFVAVAMACRLTRIVTFLLGNGGEKWYFRWLGINENSHDDIAHRDTGRDPAAAEKMIKINTWMAEQMAGFARALNAFPEGDGTVLDGSLVVWGNELATGPHGMDDIPIVLIGSAGGRLRQTGVLVDQGPQDYRTLGTSVLNLMGVPALGFGESADCGPVVGLDIAG